MSTSLAELDAEPDRRRRSTFGMSWSSCAANTAPRAVATQGRRACPYNRAVSYPSRIVCLTEETTEILYLLGEGDRVVGVSGYTVRPPEARSKPRVSSFLHARTDKIEALAPDLVLAFSDLQADIVCRPDPPGFR